MDSGFKNTAYEIGWGKWWVIEKELGKIRIWAWSKHVMYMYKFSNKRFVGNSRLRTYLKQNNLKPLLGSVLELFRVTRLEFSNIKLPEIPKISKIPKILQFFWEGRVRQGSSIEIVNGDLSQRWNPRQRLLQSVAIPTSSEPDRLLAHQAGESSWIWRTGMFLHLKYQHRLWFPNSNPNSAWAMHSHGISLSLNHMHVVWKATIWFYICVSSFS